MILHNFEFKKRNLNNDKNWHRIIPVNHGWIHTKKWITHLNYIVTDSTITNKRLIKTYLNFPLCVYSVAIFVSRSLLVLLITVKSYNHTNRIHAYMINKKVKILITEKFSHFFSKHHSHSRNSLWFTIFQI